MLKDTGFKKFYIMISTLLLVGTATLLVLNASAAQNRAKNRVVFDNTHKQINIKLDKITHKLDLLDQKIDRLAQKTDKLSK